jgi:hypothetical protein
MDMITVILQMWPCWLLGLAMIYFTWQSEYRSILKVDFKAILKFSKTLLVIAVLRFFALKFLWPQAMVDAARATAHFIPWQAVLGTFWEDACHSMPLVLAGLMWGTHKWYPWLSRLALVVVALSFGSGHIYQGIWPAMAISFYIPVAMRLGKQYGFGTVMICHILYDLSTLLSIRWILG